MDHKLWKRDYFLFELVDINRFLSAFASIVSQIVEVLVDRVLSDGYVSGRNYP